MSTTERKAVSSLIALLISAILLTIILLGCGLSTVAALVESVPK